MVLTTDRDALSSDQYRDASKLNARDDDDLRVTEAEPLADYVCSMATGSVPEDQRQGFVDRVDGLLRARGFIHITKDSGLLTARANDS